MWIVNRLVTLAGLLYIFVGGAYTLIRGWLDTHLIPDKYQLAILAVAFMSVAANVTVIAWQRTTEHKRFISLMIYALLAFAVCAVLTLKPHSLADLLNIWAPLFLGGVLMAGGMIVINHCRASK